MNSIRTLLSCVVNLDWNMYQMDVKNAFLHGYLHEEIYMHIPLALKHVKQIGRFFVCINLYID
jgi:hypothetical protein